MSASFESSTNVFSGLFIDGKVSIKAIREVAYGDLLRIDDMARDLIRLSGFEPDLDIPIAYVGLRLGEKLYEELITEGEGFSRAVTRRSWSSKGLECNLDALNAKIDELAQLARDQNPEGIRKKLQEIVPEYRSVSFDERLQVRGGV